MLFTLVINRCLRVNRNIVLIMLCQNFARLKRWGMMTAVLAGFYGFSAWLANPFLGNGSIPPGSGDLNVLLQDPGQIIHPPLLYLGYTAAAATFALAVAISVNGGLEDHWAQWLRPWALISWTFLTAGIALGSFWAYYELGWGGWWFWDPVENLALLPWLLGTALVHSLQVVRARKELIGWSLLLAVLTFLLVLLGTFIVRSGLLTSVHSFAADPSRGLYLLALLTIAAALGLGAYGYGVARFSAAPGGVAQAPLQANRQGLLLINNLLLMTLFAAVFAGTLAPTLIEILGGETYVVRERFYIPTFVYPALVLLSLMSLGVWTRWAQPGFAGRWLLVGSFVGLLTLALVVGSYSKVPLKAALMFALGSWLLLSTLGAWFQQIRHISRFIRLPVRHHGWVLAHAGLAIAVLGMSASSLLSLERIFEFKAAGVKEVFGQQFRLSPRAWIAGANYQSLATVIELPGQGTRLAETRLYHPIAARLNPATSARDREFLADQAQPTTEAAIFRGLWFDTFVNVEDRPGGAPQVTIARKAGINWIWLGAALMTLGGALATWPQRARKVD